MQDLKPQRSVESDSSWHFMGAQCDRADPLDHGQNSPFYFPTPFEVAAHRLTSASRVSKVSKSTASAPSLRRRSRRAVDAPNCSNRKRLRSKLSIVLAN